jgi:hypothetical protein
MFLCIPTGSAILERYTDPDKRSMWLRFGWAFPWQMGLFIAAVTISGFTAFRKDAVIF